MLDLSEGVCVVGRLADRRPSQGGFGSPNTAFGSAAQLPVGELLARCAVTTMASM